MDRLERYSAYGFYCGDCNSFVYKGYDSRDIVVPDGKARCIGCARMYEVIDNG